MGGTQIQVMVQLLASGFLYSVIIFVVTLVGSLPLGVVVALARMSKFRPLSLVAQVYISIMRGTPLMLQLFALMFGGGWFEFLVSGFAAAVIQLVLSYSPDQAGMPISSLFAGFLAAAITLLLNLVFGPGNVNMTIVSTLMPFLPGLALTNAIRDSMRGDLLSSGARLGQALTRAVVLAGGAGAGLWIYLAMGGVMP